jgi:hypothetical protein
MLVIMEGGQLESRNVIVYSILLFDEVENSSWCVNLLLQILDDGLTDSKGRVLISQHVLVWLLQLGSWWESGIKSEQGEENYRYEFLGWEPVPEHQSVSGRVTKTR